MHMGRGPHLYGNCSHGPHRHLRFGNCTHGPPTGIFVVGNHSHGPHRRLRCPELHSWAPVGVFAVPNYTHGPRKASSLSETAVTGPYVSVVRFAEDDKVSESGHFFCFPGNNMCGATSMRFPGSKRVFGCLGCSQLISVSKREPADVSVVCARLGGAGTCPRRLGGDSL